jgi:hypothetical protein
MRKVYSYLSYPDPTMIYHMKNILEVHGIECVVLGEYRRTGVGEIPPQEARLELWILDNLRLAEAQQILEKAQEGVAAEQQSWRCPKCGEELEGQFDQCWKCGTERS